jgi:uncharacterized protein
VTRDRDPAGRPRNARPRDALGRPLVKGAGEARDRVPDDLALPGAEAARLADQMLRAGQPFHAHEVLEASWKTGPPAERDLWQGLAQVAVGLTHAHRGNARGAAVLLARGAERVRAYQAQVPPGPDRDHPYGPDRDHPYGPDRDHPYGPDRDHPYGMDVAAVLAAADGLAARIERDGLADIPPADLLPGLLPQATEASGPLRPLRP